MATANMSERHPMSCTCRSHPLPAAMRVRDGRDAYLAENGFTLEAYERSTSQGSLFGVSFSVPNPPAHRRALRLHDLHHVATGFGTDHAGEAEIAAWQARHGLHVAGVYVSAIVLANLAVGLAVAPSRTLSVLRAPSGPSLFTLQIEYGALLDRTVGELRALLGISAEGLATRPRGLHALAPRA